MRRQSQTPAAVGWVQDPENTEFWTWKVTDELVEEAPDDGAQYGRESKTWTEIVMPEVPDETDPTVPEYVKAISTDDIANWSASYSWGTTVKRATPQRRGSSVKTT